MTLLGLISYAYGLERFLILGGPPWIQSDRFDVEAVSTGVSRNQRTMLQQLLQDRFGLRVRRETRQLPVLELVKAWPTGDLGPGLRQMTGSCEALRTTADPCGMRFSDGLIEGRGADWGSIAAQFSTYAAADRVVLDKSGLSGQFDVTLRWAPGSAGLDATPNAPAGAASTGPSLLAALQEQLGLKLVDAKGDVEVLVIDAAERPAPN